MHSVAGFTAYVVHEEKLEIAFLRLAARGGNWILLYRRLNILIHRQGNRRLNWNRRAIYENAPVTSDMNQNTDDVGRMQVRNVDAATGSACRERM
jgi:hypothetical protein